MVDSNSLPGSQQDLHQAFPLESPDVLESSLSIQAIHLEVVEEEE